MRSLVKTASSGEALSTALRAVPLSPILER